MESITTEPPGLCPVRHAFVPPFQANHVTHPLTAGTQLSFLNVLVAGVRTGGTVVDMVGGAVSLGDWYL